MLVAPTRVVLEPHLSPALYVVVSGPPASGKSTLAPVLARELGLPLLAKDTVKEALMSVLPVADVDASQQIGRAAVVTMFAVAADSPIGAVLESNFHRSVAGPEISRLRGVVVEVFCRCEPAVAAQRYRSERALAIPGTSTRSALTPTFGTMTSPPR